MNEQEQIKADAQAVIDAQLKQLDAQFALQKANLDIATARYNQQKNNLLRQRSKPSPAPTVSAPTA